jgi:hypothetical protein
MQQVVEVRNNVAHTTGGIPTDKFEEMWKVLVAALTILGRDPSGLTKLLEAPRIVSICSFPFFFFHI